MLNRLMARFLSYFKGNEKAAVRGRESTYKVLYESPIVTEGLHRQQQSLSHMRSQLRSSSLTLGQFRNLPSDAEYLSLAVHSRRRGKKVSPLK